ncbi:MAG TPA: cupredoxin domain-containing protein [Candidatus Saccharimonadales bacterium]|nr:cupredoxin domain-containing protein [Candidatus Saccharimonadales bacterium]
MGKYIVIAIVVIVLIGGGIYLMKGKSNMQPSAPSGQTTQQNAQPTEMNAQSNTTSSNATTSGNTEGANNVSYTANGFEPNSITIKAGQTVTWTNKDSDDVWVASNPHPTHTDYPGFDELKSMGNGQTYSFTFTKVGNWGYHNHLNPSQHGTVVVTQ